VHLWTSQADIDAFKPCVNVTGDISILNTSLTTINLDGFILFDGGLQIAGCTDLESVTSSSLMNITGVLDINGNAHLSDVNTQDLKSIGGLSISQNPEWKSIEGFTFLHTVAGPFNVSGPITEFVSLSANASRLHTNDATE